MELPSAAWIMEAMSDALETVAEAESLGALVNGQPENVATALPRLLELLHQANDPGVLVAVIRALGHAWDERACVATLTHATHPDPDVRLEVARAAPGGLDSDNAQAVVAGALIRLSEDEVAEIRDWATFGLGSILDLDTPEIRSALGARLDDTDFDTRCEALVGLAERRDGRAFRRTVELLRSDAVPRLAVDAARALADPRLLEALRDLESWWDVDADLLRLAIDECQPERDA